VQTSINHSDKRRRFHNGLWRMPPGPRSTAAIFKFHKPSAIEMFDSGLNVLLFRGVSSQLGVQVHVARLAIDPFPSAE